MDETNLRNEFVYFLTNEKGYPERSINFEIPIGDKIYNRKFLDLALIDPEDKEFLAIIELHSNDSPAVVRKAFKRINDYKSIPPLLNKNVLGFVIVPSENDFLIFKATYTEGNVGFVNITKEEFPSFSDLSFKAQVQERIKQDNKDALIIESVKRKERLANNVFYPLIAGVLGIILSIIIAILAPSINNKEVNSTSLNDLDSVELAGFIDRYIRSKEHKDSIEDDAILSRTNSKFNEKKLEELLYINVEKKLHNGIEGRLKNIEGMLSKEPEKTLSILEIKAQLSEIKILIDNKNNLNDEKITSLKEKTDLLSNLTWGLALTVLATLVAGLVAAYQALKK